MNYRRHKAHIFLMGCQRCLPSSKFHIFFSLPPFQVFIHLYIGVPYVCFWYVFASKSLRFMNIVQPV